MALRKGFTRTVGLIVPDISDAYFHQVARGVEDVAQAANYMVVFCNTDRIVSKELACIDLLADKRVDGIIFAGGGIGQEQHLLDYPWGHMQVVTIGPHLLPFPSIRVDDAATIETATQHLIERGARRVLCIAGQRDWLITQARLDGYHRAIRAASEELPELVVHGGFTRRGGYVAVQQALGEGASFDGLVAFNDYGALGALEALNEAGLQVPGDVAVVGCDDIPLASLVTPKLSSVNFPQYEFGRSAMRSLLELFAGREVASEIHFSYDLKVRASSVLPENKSLDTESTAPADAYSTRKGDEDRSAAASQTEEKA